MDTPFQDLPHLLFTLKVTLPPFGADRTERTDSVVICASLDGLIGQEQELLYKIGMTGHPDNRLSEWLHAVTIDCKDRPAMPTGSRLDHPDLHGLT